MKNSIFRQAAHIERLRGSRHWSKRGRRMSRGYDPVMSVKLRDKALGALDVIHELTNMIMAETNI